MARRKIQAIVCLLWMFCVVASLSFRESGAAAATVLADERTPQPEPRRLIVDRFDKAIQNRFLTEPMFGMTRIEPEFRANPHLRGFKPKDDEETHSVAALVGDGWKVGLYLFGRRVDLRANDDRGDKELDVRYRLNRPLPVTTSLREKDLPKAERLLGKVKTAFLEFQTPGSPNENGYEFRSGKWFYVARPVRASDASCLKCHTDYVITSQVEGVGYGFRRRKLGDANGVLVYAFARAD